MSEQSQSVEPKIRVRNLYKIFGDDPKSVLPLVKEGMGKAELLEKHQHVLGLRDINIDVMPRETTVIMGLSGSGKSTLVRHFNRLIDPTDGQILMDGEDVMTYGTQQLRDMRQRRMSMVFQKFALFPHRTVLENTALAPMVRGEDKGKSEESARHWLRVVGLGGYEDHHPSQLSGGMQQRVGLARALTSDAETMLMDEAFSALDPLIRTEMQDLMLTLQTDLHKTIVFISHDLDEALKLADHLVILKDGIVEQADEPQKILLNPASLYVEEFVADINRARVLRVRSIMQDLPPELPSDVTGAVDVEDNLEKVIAISGGDTGHSYVVTKDGENVGLLDMKELVKALVPRVAGGGN